jgi:hypothetical protein
LVVVEMLPYQCVNAVGLDRSLEVHLI